MSNDTSTISIIDHEVGAEHHRTAGTQCHHGVGAERHCEEGTQCHRTAGTQCHHEVGAQCHHEVGALDPRTARLRARHSKLTRDEAAMICEVADNIVRYARRQEAEVAAVVVVRDVPVVLEKVPTLPPATPYAGRVTEQIVAYMTHDHCDWVTMHGVAKALGLKYDRVRYGFRLLMDELVRGPDIRRPQGGTPIRQYRLLPEEAVTV